VIGQEGNVGPTQVCLLVLILTKHRSSATRTPRSPCAVHSYLSIPTHSFSFGTTPRRQDLRGQHDFLVDAGAGARTLSPGDGGNGLRRATVAADWPRRSNSRPI
jgi:hypothetical protein